MNILYEGVASKKLPAGVTQAQAARRAQGQGRVDAGQDAVGHAASSRSRRRLQRHRTTLLLLVGIYLPSALFGWGQQYIMAGIAQRTIYRLRRDVDRKLARLPLRYFDDHAHGDVLSRMTNDIDNICAVAAADPHADHHVGAHHRRRAHHDAHDQPAAGGDLGASSCRCRSSLTLMIAQAFAEAVRGAVEAHRRARRARRGDVHRPQRRQGLRPPGRGGRDLRRTERAALPGELQGAVHLAASSCR